VTFGAVGNASTTATIVNTASPITITAEFIDDLDLSSSFILTVIYGEDEVDDRRTIESGYGTTHYIVAEIPSGKVFDEWETSDPTLVIDDPSSSSTMVTVYGDGEVRATFKSTLVLSPPTEPQTYTLDVSESPGSWWSTTVEEGSDVSISASPPDGMELDYWSSSGNVYVDDSINGDTYVTVNGDGAVIANFIEVTPDPGYDNTRRRAY
jgi:hypothetical protein